VSFDLERLLSVQRTSRGPLRGIRPTRRTPEQRLVYCSLHDVSVPDVAIRRVSISSSRSRDRTGRLISRDEPANLIEEAGGAYRDRTGDLMLAKHALSQLS
jgi:hypothetical protein